MIRLTQHTPGYMDGIDSRRVDVSSLDEMLAVPWVSMHRRGQVVARDGEIRRVPFHRFSLSDHALMAEFDEGRRWMVIGLISDAEVRSLALPAWAPHPEGQKSVEEWNKGNTSYDDGRFQHWPLVPVASAQGDGAGE